MSRRFVNVMLLAGTIVSGWLLHIGMSIMSTMSIVTSLGYQAGALPYDMVRNFRTKSVTKVSYGLAFLGAASYVSSTFRAVLQPDWVDVIRQWFGMVFTLIISGQIVHYDRVRLIAKPPFVSRRAFSKKVHEEEGQAAIHMTGHCRPCELDSDTVMRWPQPCPQPKCRGGVHFVDVESLNAHSSVHVYTGMCDGCGKTSTYRKASHDPYVKGSTFWVKERNGDWRSVTHKEYVALVGDDPAYANKDDVIGLVAKPGKSPEGLDPESDLIGLITIRSYTLARKR